jgi:hypothetical protein
LVGVWQLERWELVQPDGTSQIPFGPSPQGRLVYTADGHMSVVISRPDRPRLADEPAARPLDQRAAAFDGAHAYAGRYQYHGDEVVHQVSVSTMPNYEGTSQRRRVAFAGDRLVLTTPPGRAAHLTPGSAVFGRLTWRRLTD